MSKTTEQELGKRIKELRGLRHLSQEGLAEQLGISRQAVAKWESGSADPSMGNLLALCRILDIPLSELTGTPEPKQSEGRKRKSGLLLLCVISGILGVFSILAVLVSRENSIPAEAIGGSVGRTEILIVGSPWLFYLLWTVTAAVICVTVVLLIIECRRKRKKFGKS